MNAEEEFTVKQYQYWMHTLPGVGNAMIAKLLGRFHTPFEVYHAILRSSKGAEELLGEKLMQELCFYTKSYEVAGEYEKVLRRGIRFLTGEDQEYPERLRKIPSPPYGLYVLGKLPPEQKMAVAMIGARECSDYGRYVATGFGKVFGERQIPVISGMARGIDSISQAAALVGGGETYAVLGCGVDICYPKSSEKLYGQILEKGGILSVFPPGAQPAKRFFPERNRIVSGLSDVILVVEARQKSGTFITVDMALEQGKEVYAVPGRLTDRLSDGCNLLLQQGAMLALSPEDLLRNVRNTQLEFFQGKALDGGRSKEASLSSEALSKEAELLFSLLDFQPQSVDELQKKYEKRMHRKASQQELLTLLMQLCMEKKAKQVSAGSFAVVR